MMFVEAENLINFEYHGVCQQLSCNISLVSYCSLPHYIDAYPLLPSE